MGVFLLELSNIDDVVELRELTEGVSSNLLQAFFYLFFVLIEKRSIIVASLSTPISCFFFVKFGIFTNNNIFIVWIV